MKRLALEEEILRDGQLTYDRALASLGKLMTSIQGTSRWLMKKVIKRGGRSLTRRRNGFLVIIDSSPVSYITSSRCRFAIFPMYSRSFEVIPYYRLDFEHTVPVISLVMLYKNSWTSCNESTLLLERLSFSIVFKSDNSRFF